MSGSLPQRTCHLQLTEAGTLQTLHGTEELAGDDASHTEGPGCLPCDDGLAVKHRKLRLGRPAPLNSATNMLRGNLCSCLQDCA